MHAARGWVLALACVGACRSPHAGTTADALPATSAALTSPSSPPPATASPADSPPTPRDAPPRVTSDWCVEGLAPLDEETCYVLPDDADGGVESIRDSSARTAPVLLVYLHGVVPPTAESPQKERVELAVLHAARRAGAAALVPRGMRGIGPGAAHDWWAWPTEPAAHAKYAASLVAKWARARRHLEQIAGAPFAHTYLAGSSNGAYFLTTLALSGDLERFGFPVDGYGAMSGGATGGRAATSLPAAARHPFYVGYGAYDETTKTSANALAELLTRAHWPTRRRELPVGHGAREEYLDEAFAFWRENR
jgi:predicted esterase